MAVPLFEFECQDCGHVFEVMVKKATPATTPACPECGHKSVERLWSSFAAPNSGGSGCGSGSFGFG